MKKIYLMLAALSFFGSHAQLQNANWNFGFDAAMTFLPNPGAPISINGSDLGSNEGCASVSDVNGNLLFYTNGVTVWNAEHQPMTNGNATLMGHPSNTQGVVIIPKPDSTKIYYIITIDGATGDSKGLYYSEVDMSVGLGQVIAGTINKVMSDHLGTLINSAYGNNSEKLTTTVHANNQEYWLITQIRDYIYSYRVSSSGISLTPEGVAYIPAVNIGQGMAAYGGLGQMKISPDGQHIGIAYDRINGGVGGVWLGDFNNSTGVATMPPSAAIISGQGYGLEFSPSSQYVYFSLNADLYQENARTANGSQNNSITSLYVADVKNREDRKLKIKKIMDFDSQTQKSNPIPTTPDNAFAGSFQLAINNKIYVSGYNNTNSLSVINNPDNYSNPQVQVNIYDLQYGTKQLGLPQWVHNFKCPGNIMLTVPEPANIHQYQYADFIITTTGYTVSSGQNVTMKAGNYVQLQPNTYIMPGSLYLAQIEECEAGETQGQEQRSQNTTDTPEKTPGLTLYPNPAQNTVILNMQDAEIQHISIVSLDGKTIIDKAIEKSVEYSININSYSKGIYIVMVQATDGKIYTEKLIVQ